MCGKGTEILNGAAGAPRIISWNITLRCPLKCAHCYVDAGEEEADGVLSTQEAFSVIDQIRGDRETGRCAERRRAPPPKGHLCHCTVRHGAGTPDGHGHQRVLIDQKTAVKLKEAGIRAVAISLDSVDPSVHDSFRGVDGVWERAVAAIGHCRACRDRCPDQYVGDEVCAE